MFSAVPVGCVPAQRTFFGGFKRECYETLNKMAIHFNSKLSSSMDAQQKELPSKLVYIDIYETLHDIMTNSSKYGNHMIRIAFFFISYINANTSEILCMAFVI